MSTGLAAGELSRRTNSCAQRAVALARSGRRPGSRSSSSPAVFIWFHKHKGWGVGWSLLATLRRDRRLPGRPRPDLPPLHPLAEPVRDRRARRCARRTSSTAAASGSGTSGSKVSSSSCDRRGRSTSSGDLHGAAGRASRIDRRRLAHRSRLGTLVHAAGVLASVIILVFFFLFNFLILFGPMLLMGISQIRGFEPGDADWGVKLEDVRGQAEAKEEVGASSASGSRARRSSRPAASASAACSSSARPAPGRRCSRRRSRRASTRRS